MEELKNLEVEQLEERKSELDETINNLPFEERERLDNLETELNAIKSELAERASIEAEKAELRKQIAEETIEAPVVQEFKEEKRDMKTNEEIRASKEYVDAYARYLISENDAEVRALLTETVSGSVPVPVLVDDIIRTAW